MRVKDSRDIGVGNKLGQGPGERAGNLIAPLAQLGRDGLHAERLVDFLFRRGRDDFAAAAQALLIEDHVSLGCDCRAGPRDALPSPSQAGA